MSVALDPIVKTVTVPLAPADAFELFTEKISRWWPLASHSIMETEAVSVTFEGFTGGRIYETDSSGKEWSWGEVLEWDPPNRVVFSWNPNPGREAFTEVEVSFTPTESAGGPSTELRLEHRHWENLGTEASRVHAGYTDGWTPVLDLYSLAATKGSAS